MTDSAESVENDLAAAFGIDYTVQRSKTELCSKVADAFGVSPEEVRVANITEQRNVVNRIKYESGWRNPVVLIARRPGSKPVDLAEAQGKVDQYVDEYMKYHRIVPRLKVVIHVEADKVVSVDRVSVDLLFVGDQRLPVVNTAGPAGGTFSEGLKEDVMYDDDSDDDGDDDAD